MVTKEDVIAAYRLILGREPETERVVSDAVAHFQSLDHLRETFIHSEEFRRQVVQERFPLDCEPELPIEVECSEEQLQELLTRVEGAWEKLGGEEPYWSVATWPDFRKAVFAQNREKFWDTGRSDVKRLLVWLQRNGVVPRRDMICLEYGCGTGRITGWLAEEFDSVIACDISTAHLAVARQELKPAGVQFVHIGGLIELERLPAFDLLFSVIVLQHNPPPVIARTIDLLLGRLRPGGIAYFQVPTLLRGYRFDCRSYLDDRDNGTRMEMHGLPQRYIFEFARKNGCRVLEVQQDDLTGCRDYVSTTFLLSKAAGEFQGR